MPFEPLTPEEQKLFPEPCQSPQHDPPPYMVITARMKWVCPACGRAVILEPPTVRMVMHRQTSQGVLLNFVLDETDSNSPSRTRAEVLASRGTVHGCCNRHADNMGCDCLREATPCPECNDSGYAVHPQNGWAKGKRCSQGCRVYCSICSDPSCDNPGGQH